MIYYQGERLYNRLLISLLLIFYLYFCIRILRQQKDALRNAAEAIRIYLELIYTNE